MTGDVVISDESVGRFPTPVEGAVYFTCLEALQNVAKHAGDGAGTKVRLWREEGSLRFEVTDDGCGFRPGELGESKGLVNMRDRITALGGHDAGALHDRCRDRRHRRRAGVRRGRPQRSRATTRGTCWEMSDGGGHEPPPVRVVIADDSALIRRGLEAMLSGRADLEFAGAGSDGEELDELVATAHPDVVVTDLRMPPSGGREGIRIATRLRRSHPQIGVVVLSQYVEPEFAIELMSDGSSRRAYLLKDRVADAPELVRAIHAVNEGGSVVDPAVVEALIEAQQRKQSSPLTALTDREREVLSLIAEGASNASIAESLV